MTEYVYILSNRSYPSLHKIGYTSTTVSERMDQLYSTGVPSRFELEFCIEVENGYQAEQLLHQVFDEYHYGKEFFKISLSQLIKIIKETLLKGELEFLNYYGRANKLYLIEDEVKKINDEVNKKKALKIEEKRKAELIKLDLINKNIRQEENIKKLTLTLEKEINKAIYLILKYSNYFNSSIVGRIIHADHYQDGITIGKRLNHAEAAVIKNISRITNELKLKGILQEKLQEVFSETDHKLELVMNIHRFSFSDKSGRMKKVIRHQGFSQFFLGIMDSIDKTHNPHQ